MGKELEPSYQQNIQSLGRYLLNQEEPDNVAVVAAVVLCSSLSEPVEGEHKAKR